MDTAPTSIISGATEFATPLASVIDTPVWNSDPAWVPPGWFEPVVVTGILIFACFNTRRRRSDYSTSYKPILDRSDHELLPSSLPSHENSSNLFSYDDPDGENGLSTSKHKSKQRSCCGTRIVTPNPSKFAKNYHSIALHKFPFLVEIFYWILTFGIYRMTHILSQEMFSDDIWDTAQANGLGVLAAEQFTPLRFLLPIQEIEVHKWFMDGHYELLTFLNRFYALVHIPGTVFFIAWYYWSAPKHTTFTTVCRAMTLCNWLALIIFTAFPCMPPRLLPKEYGFIDTVRRGNAESVWTSGRFANHLVAMPSVDFGYAFMIGSTLVLHSDVLGCIGIGYVESVRVGRFWKVWYCVLGVTYPTLILVAIIAIGNHYWLDAMAGVLVAMISLLCNRVLLIFLPLEDLLLWVLRIEKPRPKCEPDGT